MKEFINIFLYKAEGNENFGEYLFKKILNKLGFFYNDYSNVNPPDRVIDYILTGIGGNFNGKIYSDYFEDKIKKWYVWGSGVIKHKPTSIHKLTNDVLKNKCVIKMIRGPLTKQFHNIENDVLLGDPGYLASYFFKFPEDIKRSIFVQFYDDKKRKEIADADVNLSALLNFGAFDDEFFSILRNISNASIVLTGSMHIAIVAHSYGVPWALVSKDKVDITKEWKWHDTLLGIGLEKEDIKLCDSVVEGFRWWNTVKDKVRPITSDYQREIIKSFPLI